MYNYWSQRQSRTDQENNYWTLSENIYIVINTEQTNMVIFTEAKKARFEMPDKYKTKSTYEQKITIYSMYWTISVATGCLGWIFEANQTIYRVFK